MYYATYHGLHKWHEHMFEKLGWMILAKDNGYSSKIKAYLDGVNHLEKALNEKLKIVKDEDRYDDLEILLHNVKILKKKANKLLK